VTVGGIIVEAKRIRTRNGDPMMFATLDDLAGSVEMLVFGKALAEYESALAVDEVVLVKGRVDHKEAGKTCLIVQSVERFAPSEEEIEQARAKSDASAQRNRAAAALAEPVHLRVHASALGMGLIEDLKHAIEDFPGAAEIVLDVDTSAGTRRVKLGDAFRVQHTPTLRAELEHALAPLPSVATA
jgi:DNA polymerase-3 subunit alpha